MLTLTENAIPPQLQAIPKPPKQLFVVGETLEQILTMPRVAIVGSRKVTPYGRGVTQTLATELARHGIVVVSGLAFGVDAIAHQAALDAGGYTVAILPSSVTHIYPSTHQQLAQTIVQKGGLLISEYPNSVIGYKTNFVERNRLVSGFSDALLITEAATQSGTMHTARFAKQQGRPVFAVPGNITSPQSGGTNYLIQRGAHAVTAAADIIRALGLAKRKTLRLVRSENPKEQAIIEQLYAGISDGGELLARTGLTAAEFSQALTMLEITGVIVSIGNNHWKLAA